MGLVDWSITRTLRKSHALSPGEQWRGAARVRLLSYLQGQHTWTGSDLVEQVGRTNTLVFTDRSVHFFAPRKRHTVELACLTVARATDDGRLTLGLGTYPYSIAQLDKVTDAAEMVAELLLARDERVRAHPDDLLRMSLDIGCSYFHLQEREHARAAWQRAVDEGPSGLELSTAAYNLGALYADEGNDERANGLFALAVAHARFPDE